MRKHSTLIALLLLSTPAIADYATWYGNQFHGRLTASGVYFTTTGIVPLFCRVLI